MITFTRGVDYFLPSVLDALLVIRPSCNFRDGIVLKNCLTNFAQYFIELPFTNGFMVSLLHLIPFDYKSRFHKFFQQVSPINDIILGFAPVFLFIKSYDNVLVAEISQLCYKGVLRTIALGSTDGLCTWRVASLLGFQPVIVPVGYQTLGRIFNVTGSTIDAYLEVSNSSQFTRYIVYAGADFVESHEK